MGHHFGMSLARYGLDVLLVNVGAPSNDRERFRNLKAELYWGLRERVLVGDVSGLADELAYAQLASLRYEHTPSGQVAMESKDSMLKRGVRSPDRAEADHARLRAAAAPARGARLLLRRGREDRSPGLILAGLLQQPSGRDTEGVGEGVDVVERDVPFAALHRADVGAVQPGALGQRLLREVLLTPQRAQPTPECAASPADHV